MASEALFARLTLSERSQFGLKAQHVENMLRRFEGFLLQSAHQGSVDGLFRPGIGRRWKCGGGSASWGKRQELVMHIRRLAYDPDHDSRVVATVRNMP